MIVSIIIIIIIHFELSRYIFIDHHMVAVDEFLWNRTQSTSSTHSSNPKLRLIYANTSSVIQKCLLLLNSTVESSAIRQLQPAMLDGIIHCEDISSPSESTATRQIRIWLTEVTERRLVRDFDSNEISYWPLFFELISCYSVDSFAFFARRRCRFR